MNCGNESYDTHLLLDDKLPGKDKDKVSWWAEPHYRADYVFEENIYKIKGTFRSSNCTLISRAQKSIIDDAEKTEKGWERNINAIRNEYLTVSETNQKLSVQLKQLAEKDSKIFFLTRDLIRVKLSRKKLKDRLSEFAQRGSIKSICHNLDKAAAAGKLDDQEVLKDVLETTAKNFHVKGKTGNRYKATLKTFYEIIMLWGGPRLANFIAANLYGPEVHSIYRWRKKSSYHLDDGLSAHNFRIFQTIYISSMDAAGLKHGSLITETAEDETATIKRFSYDELDDVILNSCGLICENHTCSSNVVVLPVGDGENGYENIMNAFKDYTIGSYGRAIILNTFHPNIPNIPLLIMPTCNRFVSEFVRENHDLICTLYEEFLEPVIGPLIGSASDGDSRRRKLFLENSISNGNRYQPIPFPLGFLYTATKITIQGSQRFVIKDLADPDYIHNHKNLINLTSHVSRTIMIGSYHVHMNHIIKVYNKFEAHGHGLTKGDVDRDDKQNWRSAQRLSFKCVQDCLNRIENGDSVGPKDESVRGIKCYLSIVSTYVDIFCSPVASLAERIQFCSKVSCFLNIWKNFIFRSKKLNMSSNFISRETYQDVQLSFHFSVSLICFMGDIFPDLECSLDKTGSDIVESFWSANGQWVNNHHNYDYSELYRNWSHQLRLETIKADPKGPKFPPSHPKNECIWKKQFGEFIPFDKKDYPTIDEAVKRWKDGICDAQALAKSVGMSPKDGDTCKEWYNELWKGVMSQHQIDGWKSIGDEPQGNENCEVDFEFEGAHDVPSDNFRNLNTIEVESIEEGVHNDRKKCDLQVIVPSTNGTKIYKNTLISLLNKDPTLSRDRLTRIRQRNEFTRATDAATNAKKSSEHDITLHDDVAFLQDREKSYVIGKLERVTRYRDFKNKKGATNYVKPIPIESQERNNLECLVSVYRRVDELTFAMNEVQLIKFPFNKIISQVDLCANLGVKLTIDENDEKLIKSKVGAYYARMNSKNPLNKQKRKSHDPLDYEPIGGTIKTIIEPPASDSSGETRRSSRKRTALVRDFS